MVQEKMPFDRIFHYTSKQALFKKMACILGQVVMTA